MKSLLVTLAAALALLPSCSRKIKPQGPSAAAGIARPALNQAPNNTSGSLPPSTRISYNSVAVNGPFIAMTFDDGPHASNTPRLLDMLKARNIRATFFTVGSRTVTYPGIMRRIIADGHELANHTWTHPKLSSLSDNAVRSELKRAHSALVNLGVAPRMYRPPYGAITARQKQWIMNEFGYPTIQWSVDPEDWRTKSAALTRSRILNQTRPGAIILVHDIHVSSIDAMPGTLDGLLAKGFRFVKVSELMEMGNRPRGAPNLPVAQSAPPAVTFSPGSF